MSVAPRRLAFAAAAFWIALGAASAQPQSAPREYQLKAVFLYNFAKFVRWPEEASAADGPLGICVLGDDPFGTDLDAAVRGETVRGRPITTRRISSAASADGCHIVFVSQSESAAWDEVLAALDGRSVLTVGESPPFAEGGGMIAMTATANRIGLVINPAAAKRAGLTISSQLLKLGKIVGEAEERP